jgi:hypothetical protein
VLSFSKNLVIGLKARRTYALIIEPLPLPLGIEGPALALVIVVNGVGVDVTS